MKPIFLSADLYAEAIYSIRISEGLIFKLNADEKISNFPPGYIHPFIYALIYLICFKNKDLFILFTYLFNTLIMVFAIFIIKKFYEKFFNEKSNFPIFFLIFSFPFFINFYLTLNFPLYTFLFYLCLYFIDNNKKFFLIYPLLVLTRPEGIIVGISYFFRVFTLKNIRRSIIPLLFVLLLSTLPFLLNYILTGFLVTLAFRTQSLFFNYELNLAVLRGIKTFLKHLIGFLIGFPLLNIKVSDYLSTFIYPPFFLSFVAIYILKEKKLCISYFFSIFMFILFISSFSIFSGIHFSRHIAFLYPILILFLYRGLKLLKLKLLVFIYHLFIIFQFLILIFNMRTIINITQKIRDIALKAAEFIPQEKEVLLYSDPYFFFYNMEKLKIRLISPSFNLDTSREVKNFIDKESNKRLLLKFIERSFPEAEFYFISHKDPLREVIKEIFSDTLYVSDNFVLLKKRFSIK
ncbi:MAG: hypothetical protein ABDH49_06075 [Candidatus Hydrothermales bacterium]